MEHFLGVKKKELKKFHENIDETTKPYENSVEFYNGPMKILVYQENT